MHQGKHIEEQLYAMRVNISELAGKLGITRKTIYDHFKREKADLNFLQALKEKAKITIVFTGVKGTAPAMSEPEVEYLTRYTELEKKNRALEQELLETQREVISLQKQLLQKTNPIIPKPKNTHA